MIDTDADPFETPGRRELATLDAEDRLTPLAVDDQILRRDLKARLFGDEEAVRIGRYEVLRRVGRGGMGTVYLARDHELDRNVAVKLLRPDRAAGGERMLLEARALARLAHPNIVTVHEVGRHGDRVFIAME
ncbi:MAG: protein kinase, partial [Myxococcales bacterium]|nr:protein kinase [Myxococcales bacterium]